MKYKEFLNMKNGYTLEILPEHAGDDKESGLIEVPEGANILAKARGTFIFYAETGELVTPYKFKYVGGAVWCKTATKPLNDDHGFIDEILWQRHTQPEELPFVDDKPSQSLNDQYAEIETVRQSHRTASETSNPTIKETLNQRQSQYGSFEDVATATQDLLKILEKTGLKSLPSMHKEALHMICSKMVRIVNGDHNFIESWHDIAGYATLMENELRVTDGATNSRLTYQKVINGKLQDI